MEQEKNNITFNIYGGSVQIVPNATEAVQNFYGDQFAKKVLGKDHPDKEPSYEAKQRLLVFLEDEKALDKYTALLKVCEDAADVGRVVAIMCENEPHLDEARIVKKEFIKTLLPFIPNVQKGCGIDNLRVQINLAWAARKNELKHR